MPTLEQIQSAILSLSKEEFQQLRQWFSDLNQRWDEQLERDIEAGKLDALAEEAITQFKAGHFRKL